MVTAEDLKVYRNLNIASYVTFVPGLLIWVVVLARILINRALMWGLICICSLMIVFFVSLIIMFQA